MFATDGVPIVVEVDELWDQTPGATPAQVGGRRRDGPTRRYRRCFEGEIPAMLVTCVGGWHAEPQPPLAGVPLRRDHVAISNQFFTKTTDNLAENPLATMLMVGAG